MAQRIPAPRDNSSAVEGAVPGEQASYEEGLPVGGQTLDRLREELESLNALGREILLHLREITGEDFSGD